MKKKKKRQRKSSIVQSDLSKCLVCGSLNPDIHEIFSGTANRQKSIDHDLYVALCRTHHEEAHKNGALTKWLHETGQKAFEQTHTRQEFIKTFGRNYL